VFTEDSRIGINKDYSGVSQDSAFYKQMAYRFEEKGSDYQYRFAFIAEIAGTPCQYKGNIVSLGGDHSLFVLGVEPAVEPCYKILEKEIKGYDRVVLTSNAFIDKPVVFDFAMAETLSFRFLKTSVDTESYNILSQKAERSELFELYRAGSVFYFSNEAKRMAFIENIKTHEEFIQIGYNQYQVFTTN
jgi:CRISPR-associated protein Cmr3